MRSLRILLVLALSMVLAFGLVSCGEIKEYLEDSEDSDDNTAPVADAGPNQNVSTGSQVTLDGSGSADEDGDTLTFSWSFTSNPEGVTLSDETAVNPTFTPSVDGSYVLRLVVNDGTEDSKADKITVTASTPVAEEIFITDSSNKRIVRIDDMSGTNWTTFGSSGSGTNQFDFTYGIAVDSAGKIYIVDSGNHRIVRIDDMTGTNWTTYGTNGTGTNQLSNPGGISLK